MHFDDRLATVLRHRAAGERAARTQFRQLIDLLGSKAAKRDNQREESLMAAAWLRLGALGETIPATQRSAILSEAGMRYRNPELAAHLAEDEPDVAAAALSRADLSAEDWEALIPRLPVRARGFLRHRRDLPPATNDLLERLGVHDRGLPGPAVQAEGGIAEASADIPTAQEPRPAPPIAANDEALPATPIPADDSAIGTLVKRIEAFRASRSGERPEAPRLPLNDIAADTDILDSRSFGFTTDTAGRIGWADGRFAAMVIGTSFGRTPLATEIRFRQPIRSKTVQFEGGPLVAGEWVIDAAPRFTQPDGRFFGYAGIARRYANSGGEAAGAAAEQKPSSEADRLRQLLHELRTPVNAIQGFSEVIQQQLFGPAPPEYRALAASIAGDSARMLAGFDELDRLARLEAGALEIEPGASDFPAIIADLVDQLGEVLKPRTASFELTTYEDGIVPISQAEAGAIAWRLLATLAATIGAGEHLQLEFTSKDSLLCLSCELPMFLADKLDLFATSTAKSSSSLTAGMFGAGFSLRLVRAEAAAIGGELTRVDDWLLLTLPLLTDASGEPSHSQIGAAG